MKILTVVGIVLLFATCVVSESLSNQNETVRPRIPFLGSRIIGGQSALKGQFPYQVGLQIHNIRESSFCGGTLISKRSILTAAHCCQGATNITTILGSVQINNQNEPHRKVFTVSGRSIKVHEEWSSTDCVNDICLLKLPEEVELSDHIAIADLPEDVDDARDFNNENVIASGWGRVSDDSMIISPVLKYAKMSVMSNLACNLFFFGAVKETNICSSGKGGVSTCNGDSGGPLVLLKNPGRKSTVVGITSFGVGLGCEVGWPSVYTRVTKYLSWIKENMV